MAYDFNSRLRYMGTIHSRFAVNVRSMLCRAYQWPIHAHGYRNIAYLSQRTDFESIAGGLLKRLIACNRSDGEQFNFRMMSGKQYGDSIIVAGITIEDDFVFQLRHILLHTFCPQEIGKKRRRS